MKRVLNVGGNSKQILLPDYFAGWEHVLLDIDSACNPDIVCDGRELQSLEPGEFEAVACYHNLEHYYQHEIPKVLDGFLHVLKPDGFVDIKVPDIYALMSRVVSENLDMEDVLYRSPAGPITAHDVLYGFGKKIAQSGEDFFAHKMGFTSGTLKRALERAGFSTIAMSRGNLELHAFAFPGQPDDEQMNLLDLTKASNASIKSVDKPKLKIGVSLDELRHGVNLGQLHGKSRLSAPADSVRSHRKEFNELLKQAQALGDGKVVTDRRIPSGTVGDEHVEVAAWCKLGDTFREAQVLDNAEICYKRALSLDENNATLLNKIGVVLLDREQPSEAVLYLKKATEIHSAYPAALSNLGAALQNDGAMSEGLTALRKALEIDPENVSALCNITSVLTRMGRMDESLAYCDKALKINPMLPEVMLNRANTLHFKNRYQEALTQYLEISSKFPNVRLEKWGFILDCKNSLFEWDGYDQLVTNILDEIRAGECPMPLVGLLNITDDPEIHLLASSQRSEDANIAPLNRRGVTRHDRPRIAYLSADFREHPTSYLMAGVFEAHDRSAFEVIGLSAKSPDKSPMSHRLQKAFDQFHDISELNDAGALSFITSLEVDILVDLMGYTGYSRSRLVAMKPAPIIVNYLGFPASMGTDRVDYILADQYLIPEGYEQYYKESIVYLPDCFQANDDQREIGDKPISRTDAGLPSDAVVYASFNKHPKITPKTFAVWSEIVKSVPDSVLWINCAPDEARVNLLKHAVATGIEKDRIIFTERIPYLDHLKRLQLADLFLDTFPFNGGATASDALWAGLPLVTLSGRGFASRMAGSLLGSIGLPELIANNWEEYKRTAIDLGLQPKKLQEFRDRLATNRLTKPTFNTKLFTSNLENAYREMLKRGKAPPSPITIEAAR